MGLLSRAGNYIDAFDGLHGWFFENRGSQNLTVATCCPQTVGFDRERIGLWRIDRRGRIAPEPSQHHLCGRNTR